MPSYSPNLALSDFWLFAALTKHLRGIHIMCYEEVQFATRKWFREQSQDFYTDGFEKFIQQWQCCIELDGNYVEK
jgi:hypothetical protein